MKAISGKQMCRLLEERGWRLARVVGSHHIYVMPGQSVRISVPVHANHDLKLGLQKAIMKLAGLREEDL